MATAGGASAQSAAGVARPAAFQTADGAVEELVVTARRREERAQDVPIALSVIGAETLEKQGTYNVQQITQIAPSVQFSSSNPRNTSVTIRGLGQSFGLANDGLESGVGLYIDQVYFARPAASTFDLLDLERVEVLRGPQGTLFGKNTTAGALNVTTRSPTFTPETALELSLGDLGFLQGKATISGPLLDDRLAGRLSIAGTRRDGTIFNAATNQWVGDQNNQTLRGQLLFRPSSDLQVRLTADYSRQFTTCCTQVYVTVGQTLKPAAQQFPALAAGLGYAPPSTDPFARVSDVDAKIQANQSQAGLTAIADWDLGFATLTSVTGWRTWEWDPANDRDYTRLSILKRSENASEQDQISQELRLTSNGTRRIDWVAGVYAFRQTIDTQGIEEWGPDAAYWLLGPTLPAALLDGYRRDLDVSSTVESYAVFAQATWNVNDRLRLTPGVRYTEETKDADYVQTVAGGLVTTDPALVARKLSIARPQAYRVDFSDGSVSGQVNLAYDLAKDVMVYGTWAKGYKSGGINLTGLPTTSSGAPALASAVVRPEDVTTLEIGLKSQILDRRLTFNAAAYATTIEDFQANVVDAGPGALRGYLANIAEVGVRGVEFDLALAPVGGLSAYATLAYTDGEYVSFANGPCPLERVSASTTSCDLSGLPLPGVSEWAGAIGGEYRRAVSSGEVYAGADYAFRSEFYSDASDSRYALIDGYGLLNLRAGFKSDGPWEAFVWARNALDEDYLQFVSVQAGNSGLVVGTPGDPRTVGVTLRVRN
jgi:iron complex outermembrane receptor protein